MSEFGGLWKNQTNPVYTKSVKSLQNAEVGHYTAGLQILWYKDYDLNYTQNIKYLYT